MAFVAAVTLPLGLSVVLISISCLKMSRASARSAGDVVGNADCANAESPNAAVHATTARSVGYVWRGMGALYGSAPAAVSVNEAMCCRFTGCTKSIYRDAASI